MLAMEGANKERNRLHLAKHTHIHKTRPFSKTHILMLAMEREDKKQVISNQTYTYKIILNTKPFSKTHHLMLVMERADKEKNRLLQVKNMHITHARPFNKTHRLMFAMESAE